MATISLAAYSGAQISRLARAITTATAAYGADDRVSFSTFTVSDVNPPSITFIGPDAVSRTVSI